MQTKIPEATRQDVDRLAEQLVQSMGKEQILELTDALDALCQMIQPQEH